MNKRYIFVVVMTIFTLLMASCQPAAPTVAPQPTAAQPQPAQPTTPPAAAAPTTAAATEVTQPTAAPAQPTALPAATEAAPSGGSTTGAPLKFYFVQHALCAWDSFWCTVEDGIKTAGKQMGVDVTILGPDKFDLEKTAALIDQAVAAKPDGIAFTVTDATLFKEPIMKAINAGIPVVAYNNGKGPDKDGIPYLTFLGQDEYQAGYQAGVRMIAAGAKQGVCVNHQVGNAALDVRCTGFADAFKQKNLKEEMLGVKGEDAAQAQTTISDYYTANPSADAFLTLGPSSANPFYAFVDASNPGKIFHGTFDLSPEIEAKIKAGTTMFAIDQQPFLQGYGAVMWLTMVKRYGIKPALPVTPTGPGFVDAKMLGKQPQPDKALKLIMVQHALCAWDSFWCVVENGIKTAATEMKVDYQVLGPDKFDLEKTASLIDQAAAAKPDGIAFTVTDVTLFKDPIMKAINAGIPVVAYNNGKGPDKDGIPYLTFLGQDEAQAGYQAGVRMIAAGAKQGVCVNHQVGNAALDVRCKGFIQAFTEKNLKAEMLGVKGEDAAQAQTTISDYYTANPSADAFLTLGPSSANPFYAFVDASNPGKIFHGTFDLSPEILKKIQDGTSLFAIDQQPFLQGYEAVMWLMLYLRYNITPALGVMPTGPGFVDKSNVDIVQKLAGTYR